AEDGIRYRNVTGVQTCALPICIGGKPIELGQVHSDLLGFHAPRLSRFGIPFPNNWFESAGRIGQCQITGDQMWKLSSESWILEERWSNPVAAPSRSRR